LAQNLSDRFHGLLPINCFFLAFACVASRSPSQIPRQVVRDREAKSYGVQ
jgi:hypothetical protein